MHKVTQWGEYGIHIMLYIANKHYEGQKLVSALEISESQNISLNYTQQILMKLRQGGLIESERGPKGGFMLSKNPTEINLKEILTASEGDTVEIICENNPINQEKCSKEAFCYLKSVWYGLKDIINGYLEKISLQDLLNNLLKAEITPLVKLPTLSTQSNGGPQSHDEPKSHQGSQSSKELKTNQESVQA